MATATYGFSVPKSFFITSLLAGLVIYMSGCSNDAFTSDSGNNNNNPPNNTSPGGAQPTPPPSQNPTLPGLSPIPHTIKLSYKVKDATVVQGGGFYSWQGGVIVTDEDGNAVADGTVVNLNIIDSVIAQGDFGSLAAPSGGVSGNTLTDPDPLLGNATNPSGLGLNSLYVFRNNAYHFIEQGDHVFLINADEQDKDRTVTAVNQTSILVNSNYVNAYPNSIYDGTALDGTRTTNYLVGVSALGAEIAGEDANGDPTRGYTVTKDGRGTFRVTYPSSSTVLNTGCGAAPYYDTRSLPVGDPTLPTPRLGSARVYVVASVNSNVVTVDDQFCFAPVAGFTVDAPGSVSGSAGTTYTVSAVIRDGGDTAVVPFTGFTAAVSNDTGATVSIVSPINNGITDENGNAIVQLSIGGAQGSSATLTITSEQGTSTTTVFVN